ncbi:N-acetylmuramic acid 6-phosphate etherase [Spiroplasma alleghenense]|uniref:N-acetylmuramic acid 6-phosphate etherase n=1 Tax=Spiroplasma alleghenense TaxID=216931 RepID=A0A345Z4J4_9MOLU|nr:N-acetylmuramic acid 6-phosphate etherase [Spiroplasma alleghenense]AXK51523.1 N-acetylmuramic acid 6-phosphate etherase [Spiroplasma alleghenense]
MKEVNLQKILTESVNENTHDLDLKSTTEILNLINSEDDKIAKAVKQVIPAIAKVIDQIYLKFQNNGRLIYLGAGSSGRIGVLDASEMLPTYGVEDKFFGYIAGGDLALRIPIEGAEDSEDLAIEDLKKINLTKDDTVLGIGASGRTPYVIGALKYAKEIGAFGVGLCMTSNSAFQNYGDAVIEVLSGPEVVTGSTRMKSGTATKMVLNMISTTLMIKSGKVYDNLMIDVKATNEKLVARCIKIVNELTNTNDNEKTLTALQAADMDCKFAAIMIKNNINYHAAQELFLKNNYKLRGLI